LATTIAETSEIPTCAFSDNFCCLGSSFLCLLARRIALSVEPCAPSFVHLFTFHIFLFRFRATSTMDWAQERWRLVAALIIGTLASTACAHDHHHGEGSKIQDGETVSKDPIVRTRQPLAASRTGH
jgi:hypothetical protein